MDEKLERFLDHIPEGEAVIAVLPPELAARILQAGPNRGRSLREGTIEEYADMMRLGQWVLQEEEPLVLDKKNGEPIDGRHRLEAQKRAKRTLRYYIKKQ